MTSLECASEWGWLPADAQFTAPVPLANLLPVIVANPRFMVGVVDGLYFLTGYASSPPRSDVPGN